MTGRRLALLVATGLYEDPAFRQLKAPSADVEALQGVLTDPAIGGYEVQLLSNAASHQVNQEIEGFFADADSTDLVLLYFSGHGFKDDAGRLYMITHNSRRQLLGSTAVSAQFVRDQLDRCRSRCKIVILDCCYAGAFPVGATKSADSVDVLGGLGGRGCAVITASSALEYAFESGNSSSIFEIDDTIAPSIFTGALIDGLATGKADLNGDGLIDIDELYDHVYKQVKSAVPQQTPGRRSDVEGTLYIATSPRGAQPIPLPPEFWPAIRSPLTSTRFGVIDDLVTFCSGANLGTAMSVLEALSELIEDDSNKVAKAARAAYDRINKLTGQIPASSASATVMQEARTPEAAHEPRPRGRHSPEKTTLRHETDQDDDAASGPLVPAAQREAAQLRTADQEIAEKRAVAERDIAKVRTITEREVAQLKARAKRERDEILTRSKRQADEMRSQAQLILEESEAQRAKSEAEFEIQLTARWEEAQRQEAERFAAAQSATQKLVAKAEQRASAAEQHAVKASAIAERALREGEELLELVRKSADEVMLYARELDIPYASHRRMEELDKQRQVVSDRLAEFRELLEQVLRPYPNAGLVNDPARAPEFNVIMRGYDRMQVDEYLARLVLNPSLPVPNFETVMRGYDKLQVDRYVQSIVRPA